MPRYEIVIPGRGTYEVESPTELTDEQAYAAALTLAYRDQPVPVQPPTQSQRSPALHEVLAELRRADDAGNTAEVHRLAKIANQMMDQERGSEVQQPLISSLVKDPTPLDRVLAELRRADDAGNTAEAHRLAKIANEIMDQERAGAVQQSPSQAAAPLFSRYEVEIPGKGTFTVESPTELTDVQAYVAALAMAYKEQPGAVQQSAPHAPGLGAAQTVAVPQTGSRLMNVDLGKTAIDSGVGALTGLLAATCLHWLITRQLWHRPRSTCHDQGLWFGSLLASLSFGLGIGSLVNIGLPQLTPEDWYKFGLSWSLILPIIYFVFGYMVGWIFRRLRPLSPPAPSVSVGGAPPDREEALYAEALGELNGPNRKPALWAMALAQSADGGNTDGAYIKLRVAQLRKENDRFISQLEQNWFEREEAGNRVQSGAANFIGGDPARGLTEGSPASGLLKSEVSGDAFERSFFQAVCLEIRARPANPVFHEAALLQKTKELLAIGGGKPAGEHLRTYKVVAALLRMETQWGEFTDLAKRAIRAADAGDLDSHLLALDEAQRWLAGRGCSFLSTPSGADLISQLKKTASI